MYEVEIKHPNPAIGAKNKKLITQDLDESVEQFTKWIKWLGGIEHEKTDLYVKYKGDYGYEITWKRKINSNS